MVDENLICSVLVDGELMVDINNLIFNIIYYIFVMVKMSKGFGR